MAVTWKISQLERTPQDGINRVHYHLSDSETVGEVTHNGQSYGTVSFTPDATKDGYVSWDSITKETVLSWTRDALGSAAVAAMEASIAAQIAESKSPSILFGYPEGWES
jgi:hypothetical protein